MLGVKLLKHGSDTATSDRRLTASAEGASLQMVVGLTVGKTFVIKEATTGEQLMAILKKYNILNIYT